MLSILPNPAYLILCGLNLPPIQKKKKEIGPLGKNVSEVSSSGGACEMLAIAA